MINGLGVLGWGVGGIEAEAAMLGQPMSMLIPQVIGFKLDGELPEGATATDLVLTVTEMLRKKGVVGKFVEFFGPGVTALPLADRATIGNMSPEFGSTCAIFPIDAETLRYMAFSRPPEGAHRPRRGLRQGAGPLARRARRGADVHRHRRARPRRRSSRRWPAPSARRTASRCSGAKEGFRASLAELLGEDDGGRPRPRPRRGDRRDLPGLRPAGQRRARPRAPIPHDADDAPAGAVAAGTVIAERSATAVHTVLDGETFDLDHGHVVIAAITSCTNTSNPSVMLAAGLLARNAVARGLTREPWVKTSLAPGSKVVTEYLERAGLTGDLEALGFNLVGYGCTTCIGNSGPLPDEISRGGPGGRPRGLARCCRGNRNFEGRINPDVKMNYLASPPLVVAYAIAGTMDIDLINEPLGRDADGAEVYLKDIWPSTAEVARTVEEAVQSDMFRTSYGEVFDGDENWQGLEVPTGDRYAWSEDSTYVAKAPYFEGMEPEPSPVTDIEGARVLAKLGDSVTTDHISPAGAIKKDGPAGAYLQERGVEPRTSTPTGRAAATTR